MSKVSPQNIQLGDRIPSESLKTFDTDSPKEVKIKDINTDEIFSGKTVVFITFTGAFTPVCTNKQLTAFKNKIEDIKSMGVDEIVCLAVNDAYTLAAFAKQTETFGNMIYLADGNAVFARKCGLLEDLTDQQLGFRIRRSAMVVKDGEIKYIGIDPSGEKESSADAVIEFLKRK